MIEKSLDKEKWIEVGIGIRVTPDCLIEVKKELREYAEELNWKLISDKKGDVDEDGSRRYDITIKSKTKLSPEEVREIKIKLIGFVISIRKDILKYDEKIKDIKNDLDISEDFKNILISWGEVLQFSIPFNKFIKFERENYDLTKATFLSTLTYHKKAYKNALKSYRYWFGFNKKEKEEIKDYISWIEKQGV